MNTAIDWFKDAKGGVFLHYLAENYFDLKKITPKKWDECVNHFDVEKLAEQLDSINVAYCYITLGQNSGYYCAPNTVYDSIVGTTELSKCSQRDLVGDLCDALEPRGIKVLAYCPSGAPNHDPDTVKKLKWEWGLTSAWPDMSGEHTGKRIAEFQEMRNAIIKEWSLRWGKRVFGWWVDGCYFVKEMYQHEDAPNFKSFVDAIKAGNPESIVAFNTGVQVPVVRGSVYDDYTAGEISRGLPVADTFVPIERWVDGAQYHVLSYLGETWGGHQMRFSDELAIAFTRYINSKEGVVTWDVPIEKDGSIPQPFLKQLAAIGASSCE